MAGCKRFGTFQADDVRRLKQLEVENARLKKVVAERDLEIEMMKEIAAKMYGPLRPVCLSVSRGGDRESVSPAASYVPRRRR